MQLSNKRKNFSPFFVPFLDSTTISKTLKEKMILIANVFPKLQTVKSFASKLSQEDRFRAGLRSQHVKGSQMLAKYP